jgi:hypothetical protein
MAEEIHPLLEIIDQINKRMTASWTTPDQIAEAAGFMRPDPSRDIEPADYVSAWRDSAIMEPLPFRIPTPFVDAWEETKEDVRQFSGFVQRYICGVEPDPDVDFEILRSNAIWEVQKSMTVQAGILDEDVVEFLWGGSVIPLCYRQIPAKGTE